MIDYCPVCHDQRTDLDAIKRHNIQCATTGERAYPERQTFRRPRPTEVLRDWQR